jgi:penicillin-binding protein 1C
VLPNSPALVFPGKNQDILKSRRDKLLRKLYNKNYLDSLTLILALEEPLIGEPRQLPSKAPHLTDLFYLKNRGERVHTTIDPTLQEKAVEIINSHQKILENNLIFNSACIIIGVEKGDVLAYVGNSTGSILKPILYAGMQHSGEILPKTLVPDIPTRFPGFSPKNFDQMFSGAVTADNALSQSLNIPSVRMLQKYSPEKFLSLLQNTGFTTFNKTAEYYGLSLILGGGEASLWELTGVYASLSRILRRFNLEKKYNVADFHQPLIRKDEQPAAEELRHYDFRLSAASIWLTYEALQHVNRPETETGWQYFTSSPNLAWKTGTSFGFRDGWAVGTTPSYVIGVWAGNADGEGRPGLTGISAAAPILFDIFNYLGSESWFEQPLEEMTTIRVCSQSGFRAGPDCPETKEIWACVGGLRTDVCPYHHIVHLDKTKTLRITSACASPAEIINESWFVLPPAMEYFYRQKHPEYRILPPPAPGCTDDNTIPVMEFIYPPSGVKIFIPRDQTGRMTRVVPEVAHRNPGKKIYWHLDNKFLATTRFIHQIDLLAESGQHILTVVDEDGNSIQCVFTITSNLQLQEN